MDRRIGAGADGGHLRFLHVAGASVFKGTDAVLEAWRRHPEWPTLVLLQSPVDCYGRRVPPHAPAPNVEVRLERIPDEELRALQNECAFHVCPSEVEGFGQIILEALSVGAVVLTTDGEPMNELVHPGVGLLVRPESQRPMGLGTRYSVDPEALSRCVEAALALDAEARRARSAAARMRWEDLRSGFRSELAAFLARVDPHLNPAAGSGTGPAAPPP